MKRCITIYFAAKNMNLNLEKTGLCALFVTTSVLTMIRNIIEITHVTFTKLAGGTFIMYPWAHDKCTTGQSSKGYACDFCQ